MKNITRPIATHCQSLPTQQVEKPLCAVGTFHPATFDTITLYDLCEMNVHIRRVSIYNQWKQLRPYYPELTVYEHAMIIKEYINQETAKP